MRYVDKFIPGRSRLGLPTTASDVAQQRTSGNYATTGLLKKRRERERRQVKTQRNQWKERRTLIRVGTLNIGIMNGKKRELADMMKRRSVDLLSLQETK